jgi:hypothetical protein
MYKLFCGSAKFLHSANELQAMEEGAMGFRDSVLAVSLTIEVFVSRQRSAFV